MITEKNNIENRSEFLLYTAPDGNVKVEVFLRDETIWLSQDKISQLFGVQRPAITKHLNRIFAEGELNEGVVSSILEHTTPHGAIEGKTQIQKTRYYNLDAIISVGYRVNSSQATQFRIRATQKLKEYIIKGFVMDDERLKNPNQPFGKDYFDEQLERIRDIRSSERRFYQKISDIYAQCSIDYDPDNTQTAKFFATVQNKLHRAVTGQTAAEIIHHRVDNKKPNIGLNTRKYAPNGPIRKSDATIAKNYLTESELDQLNRIVTMYLDYAELQATKQNVMTMQDWIAKLDSFLLFNEYEILDHLGTISNQVATELAEKTYDEHQIIQDKNYISDFDRFVEKIGEK